MRCRSASQIVWLDNLRVIAAFFVVTLHVSAPLVYHAPLGSFDWWAANFWYSVGTWAVPIYIMLSGALLLDPSRADAVSDFYYKRAARIFFPLLFWTLFYLAVDHFDKGVNIINALKSVLHATPYYHMWFLYMICGLYVVTPLLRVFTRGASVRKLLWIMVILLGLAMIYTLLNRLIFHIKPLFCTYFLPYLGYFMMGRLLMMVNLSNRFSVKQILWGIAACIIIVMTGMYFLSVLSGSTYKGNYFYSYLSPFVVLMSFFIFLLCKDRLPDKHRVKDYRKAVLGIYLMHPFILLVGEKLLGMSANYLNAFVTIPAIGLCVFVISYYFVRAIRTIPVLRKVV